MKIFWILPIVALSIFSCKSDNGGSSSAAAHASNGTYAHPFTALVNMVFPAKRNIAEFEFEVEEIIAVNSNVSGRPSTN